MEYIEGLFDFITKRFKKPEGPTVLPGWKYEMYREYLLAVSRGRDYLLPIENYPPQIELNNQWHDTLNQIRTPLHESWALVGYEDGQRRLVLPSVAEKGLSHSVPYETRLAGLSKARLRAGITDMVGDIHSHPHPRTHPSWIVPPDLTSEGQGSFSMGDLYYLLKGLSQQRPSDPNTFFMLVTEGNENIGAFGSRGTLERTRNSLNEPLDLFAKKWYEKFGWNYLGCEDPTKGGGELAEKIDDNARPLWAISRAVAHHYQIVLYRGFTNGPLIRNYPQVQVS